MVKHLGKEIDLTSVNFNGILPCAVSMAVHLSDWRVSVYQESLSEESQKKIMESCSCILALDETKSKVLESMQSKMARIVPNLTAIVGGHIAAKLLGLARGSSELVNMPACNLQNLGAKKSRNLSFETTTYFFGVIFESEIVQSNPPVLRKEVCRLLAQKCSLAAQVDYMQGNVNFGGILLNEIREKIDILKRAHPPSQPKPIVISINIPRKKLGGQRHRKGKEKNVLSRLLRVIRANALWTT